MPTLLDEDRNHTQKVNHQGYSSSAADDRMRDVASTAPDKGREFSWKMCCSRLEKKKKPAGNLG
jgi:hypothetical protein